MRAALFPIALAAALAAVPAAAQMQAQVNARTSTYYDRCLRAAPAADTARLKCSRAEIKRQDERVETAYKLARKRLKGADRRKLRADQHAWRKARGASCAATGFAHDACLIDATIRRTLWLERQRRQLS